MTPKKNIAIFLYEIGDVSGGGGAERFWADFFELYKQYPNSHFNVFLFCDKASLEKLRSIHRITDETNIVLLRNCNNRYKESLEFADFLTKLWLHRIDLIHIAEYTTSYFERCRRLSRLPRILRPALSTTLVNCLIPYRYETDPGFQKPINQILSSVRFDGIYSWYLLLKDFMQAKPFKYSMPYIQAASYCFADTRKFKPAGKKNIIVYAARMAENKQPLLFVESVAILYANHPQLLRNWKIEMYGKGPLSDEVREKVDACGLGELITIDFKPGMEVAFSQSKCFVSTQDYENFTSLSMLEAMACGNVIVSRNVGQTHFFARENVNAFLAKTDDAKGISDALAEFLTHESQHEKMMHESIRIATEVHTKENFFNETEKYWQHILN